MLPNWLWPTPSWGNGLPSAIRVPVLMQIRPSMHKALTCSKYTEKEMPTLPCSTAGKRKTLRTHATYGSRLNSARTAQSRYPWRDSWDPRTQWEEQGDFSAGKGTFLLNGKPFVIKAAELHYPRIPKAYWDQRIKLCKALGMNTICLYVFWNSHESQPGVFDFTGQNDLAEFCRLCQQNDMYVILRPGPYVCAEWEMGGLPWWLLKKKRYPPARIRPLLYGACRYLRKSRCREVAGMTIQNGGPIIRYK